MLRAKHLKHLLACSAMIASGAVLADASCVLTCPANVTLATAPGAPTVVYPYTVTSAGTCGNVLQLAGLPPGSAFAVGTTTNVWGATDPPNQTCSFTVTVTATPAVIGPSEPIPALGPLALALLATGLAAGGGWAARRRSTRS